MTEHPDLWKGRRRLLIPIKDNNAGKELSAVTISRWICTTIVDSHAALWNGKSIPGKVKAQEVCVVATSLQLINKVDLHTVMKAGKWSSGGTFTSFYLRDICTQADSIRRTVPPGLPTLICQILNSSKTSYELFELFATQLKFLDRN